MTQREGPKVTITLSCTGCQLILRPSRQLQADLREQLQADLREQLQAALTGMGEQSIDASDAECDDQRRVSGLRLRAGKGEP